MGVGSRYRPHHGWKPVAASVTRPRMSLVLQPFLPFPHSCQGPSPHQQGRDARMIEQCFVGIDVSQDRLDVLLLPQATGFSVANNEAGWNALIARLRDVPTAYADASGRCSMRRRKLIFGTRTGFRSRRGRVVNRPPSPLAMLLSPHTR